MNGHIEGVVLRFSWCSTRHRCLLSAFVFAFTCLCFLVGCDTAVTENSDKPKLRLVGDQEIKVGEGERSTTVVLQVINDSQRRIVLDESITTTCGCTSAELKKLSLEPQESTELTINVRYNGSVMQQVEAIVTESESKFQLRVPLSVRYSDVFAATPGTLRLCQIEGDPTDLTAQATIYLDTALEDLLRVESIPGFVSSARLVKTEMSDLVLIVSVPPDLDMSSKQGNIVLTAGDDKKLTIAILLDHEPLVSVTPQSIDLTVKSSDELVVRTLRAARIEAISTTDGLSISHETIGKAARTHLIRAEKRDSIVSVPQSILVSFRMMSDETIVTKEIAVSL